MGRGSASKEQVQFMIQRLLGKGAVGQGFDATDAVAIALCHAHQKVAARGLGKRDNKLAEKIEALKQDGRKQSRLMRNSKKSA